MHDLGGGPGGGGPGGDGRGGGAAGVPDGGAGIDLVRPFLLESSGIRGRIVRLGPLLDSILTRHDYPDAVAGLLAELLALAGALSSLMKYDGVFTLQTKGDGPVNLSVADVDAAGVLRGYAGFDAARAAALPFDPAWRAMPIQPLLGQGYLAFTVDQGPDTHRYQGIVALTGESLADCLQHYFQQSEQVQTGIQVAARRGPGGWRAGCLVLQHLPEDSASSAAARSDEDAWRRAMVLQASCTPEELLAEDLPVDDLLYRLFHEEGVRVFDVRHLREGCRCSREKLEQVLLTLPRDEVEHLKVDGRIVMVCQFCNRQFLFDDDDLHALLAR